MKTRRPLSINNSLAHGICNYRCRLCAVPRPGFSGPKEFQPREVTQALVDRIREAARAGITIRYVTQAGDGEPTLHPEFLERIRMFGTLVRTWDIPEIPAPEIAVVTNGARLLEPGLLETLCAEGFTLVVSFPSAVASTYGTIMLDNPEKGEAALAKVMAGLREVFRLRATGALKQLYLHVSPPERDLIRRDLPTTIETLTKMGEEVGLKELTLVMFPATTNRSGLIANRLTRTDSMKDLFKRWNGVRVHGVQLKLELMSKRFFRKTSELVDLFLAFDFPCLWNANLFITPHGDSICPNDQAVRQPLGNLQSHSILQLMEEKERYQGGIPCQDCDSAPHRMRGSLFAESIAAAAKVRMRMARWRVGTFQI